MKSQRQGRQHNVAKGAGCSGRSATCRYVEAMAAVTTELVEQGEHSWLEATIDDGNANVVGIGEIAALSEAFDVAIAQGSPMLLTGRPSTFVGGVDLAALAQSGDAARQFEQNLARLVVQAVSLPVPLVIAAAGDVIGLGALLCLASDLALIAKGDNKVGFGEVREGRALSPVSVEMARTMLRPDALLDATAHARLFSQPAAAAVGFVDEIEAPDALLGWAREKAARLGTLPVDAYRTTKLAVRAPLIERLTLLTT